MARAENTMRLEMEEAGEGGLRRFMRKMNGIVTLFSSDRRPLASSLLARKLKVLLQQRLTG